MAAQTGIILCAGVGTYLIALSFNRGHSISDRLRGVRFIGASIDPAPFAVGIIFLIIAWLTYKKWSSGLKK